MPKKIRAKALPTKVHSENENKEPGYTIKTSSLQIENPPPEIETLYHDMHDLGAHVMKFFLALLGRPLDNSIQLPPEHADLYYQFANGVLKVDGGPGSDDASWANPENCYALLFTKETESGSYENLHPYNAMKKALSEGLTWEQLKGLPFGKKGLDGKKKRLDECSAKSLIVPLEIWQQFHVSGDLAAFGQLLFKTKNCPALKAALKLRELGILPLEGPGYDGDKLRGILSAVFSRLKSWRACDLACKERKAALQQDFEQQKAKLPGVLYERFCQFAQEVWDTGYGVNGRVLHGVEAGNKTYETALAIAANYPDLKGNFEALGKVYFLERHWQKAAEGARITLCDEATSRLEFPLGETSRGYPVMLSTQDGCIHAVVSLPGKKRIALRCRRSDYFQGAAIQREEKGFTINWHRGPTPLHGDIKEPCLTVKNGHYMLKLRVRVPKTPIPQGVLDTKLYYQSAVGQKCKYQASPIRIISYDLGLNPLAAYAVADTGRPGLCPVFGGGSAAFVDYGKIGQIGSGRLYQGLYQVAEQCFFMCKYLRISKKQRDGVALNKRELDKLPEYLERLKLTPQADNRTQKDMLGRKIGTIKSDFKVLKDEFQRRDCPDRRSASWEIVSGEAAQMLNTLKRLRSLLKSWNRHPWPTEMSKEERKRREEQLAASGECADCLRHYNGLRKDFTNKLVCALVRKAKECRAQIVVVEDFEHPDYEDSIKSHSQNDLWSLFAPQAVIVKLEAALSEVGIPLSKVDPRHSSQLAALTGEFGYRNRQDFYYEDQGICHIDANINAAMGLLRRLLMRYSVPSEIRGWGLEDGAFLVPATDSKRLNAYLKKATGKTHARLLKNCTGYCLEGLTPRAYEQTLADRTCLKMERFYNHGGHWFRQEDHWGLINTLVNKVATCDSTQIQNALHDAPTSPE